MYSFEGNFRRHPIQSLGGASKKEERDILLQRTQEERNSRELRKLQISSAIKIQSFYRSAKVRHFVKDEVRQLFIADQVDIQKRRITVDQQPDRLFDLTRKLLFFFSVETDGEVLIWLCQLYVQHQATVVQSMCSNQESVVYQVKNLLHKCCSYLMRIAGAAVPLAVPMRMLEIYTKPEVYHKSLSPAHASSVSQGILHFLINKAYYKCMRVLIKEKIPPSVEMSASPPTAAAASILDLIVAPFSLHTQASASLSSLRRCAIRNLCQELLCQPMGEQMYNFILPALVGGTHPLPAAELLQSVVLEAQGQPHLSVDSSVWLLYAVLTIVGRSVSQLSPLELKSYVFLLSQLVPCLRPPQRKPTIFEDADTVLDDDDMDTQELGSSQFSMVRQCLSLLDHQDHVNALVSTVTQHGDATSIVAMCTICCTLHAHLHSHIHRTRLLYTLAFKRHFLRHLWLTCTTVTTQTMTAAKVPLIQQLARGVQMKKDDHEKIITLLSVFCHLFGHSLLSLHDTEFHGSSSSESRTMSSPGSDIQVPFTMEELSAMTLSLRDACVGLVELVHPDSKLSVRDDYKKALQSVGAQSTDLGWYDLQIQVEQWAHLFKVMSQLLKHLYARDNRRPFCPPGHWLAKQVQINADKPSQLYKANSNAFVWRKFGILSALNPNRLDAAEGLFLSTLETRHLAILTELPFVVSFEERVKILQKLILQDRREHQGEMRHLAGGPVINLAVRRTYLYEDAFDRLSPENEPSLKLRMQVQLKNFTGLDEAGIDGGGIFREFMSELLKSAFDPNRGFFKFTLDQLLYPNPQAKLLVEDFTQHYYFMGRILGKAIFENMLVELPFASFFLNKLLSRHSGDVDIHHLESLDPEMYKNLLFLKNYEGDVGDLGLDFTVVNNDYGEAQIEDLKMGGKDEVVTNHNRIEYIHLMADYRLNRQIRVHCQAFRKGLADVVNIDWLRMFDPRELQVLISGAYVPVDVGDLRRNTNYSGGYGEDHPVILMFWKVVENFTDQECRQLLKFVTSCSRPPLLGFKELYPAFCVQNGGGEVDRLPSASTCMNLLKLPEFKSEDLLKQKLLYAITSGAGFELS